MPRCSCAGNSCSCLINEGAGVRVDGTGNASAPYVISLNSDQEPVDFSSDGVLNLANKSMVGAVLISMSADASGVDLPPGGGRIDLLIRQGGSGTNTIVWPAEIIWPGGTEPVLQTAVGKVDWVALVHTGGVWAGMLVGGNLS